MSVARSRVKLYFIAESCFGFSSLCKFLFNIQPFVKSLTASKIDLDIFLGELWSINIWYWYQIFMVEIIFAVICFADLILCIRIVRLNGKRSAIIFRKIHISPSFEDFLKKKFWIFFILRPQCRTWTPFS